MRLLTQLRKSKYADESVIKKLQRIYLDKQDIPALKELWKRVAVADLERGHLNRFLNHSFASIHAENFYSKKPCYEYSTIDEDLNVFVRIAAKSNPLFGWVKNNRKTSPGKKLNVGFVLEGFDNKQAPIRTYYPFAEHYDRNKYQLYFYSRLQPIKGYENLTQDFFGLDCVTRNPLNKLSPMEQVKFLAENIVKDEIDILVFQTIYFVPVYNFLACLHPALFQAALAHQQPEFSQEIDLLFATPRMSLESLCKTESYPMAITKTYTGNSHKRENFGIPKSAILLVSAAREAKYLQKGFLKEIDTIIEGNVYYLPLGLSSANGVKNKDHIITVGFQDDVMSYMAMADIYVDLFPLGTASSVIEAMQAGIPVVTSMPDFEEEFKVNNEQTAYQYVNDERLIAYSVDGWKGIINTLIRDKSLRIQLGSEMQEKIKAYEPKKISDWFFDRLHTHFNESLAIP